MKIPAPLPGDVLTYAEMCHLESAHLVRGMNFRLNGGASVVLMSQRADAPYLDRIEDNGRTLVYQGHNAPLSASPAPDWVDQPDLTASGKLTPNDVFHRAALGFKNGDGEAELVRVYEKLRAGAWVFNGTFALVDVWREDDGARWVWKFRLELVSEPDADDSEVSRVIASHLKQGVWTRDGGAREELNFDFVKPPCGTAIKADGIRIRCARHRENQGASQ